MAFLRTKYEADNGEIHPIRLNTLTAAVAGTAPEGATTSDIIAKVSKSNREFGIRPRGVILTRTVGTAPDTFTRRRFLPVLTEAAWGGSGFAPDATITINSIAWKVLRKVPEDF